MNDPLLQLKALTPREVEVLGLIAIGMPNVEIARFLSISSKTVEKHRERVMDKLGLRNAVHLTHFALFTGLIANRHAPRALPDSLLSRLPPNIRNALTKSESLT